MILLLALFASIQSIASGEYPPDTDCQEYSDGSTMAMSECLTSQSDTWERRLQAEYRAAIARAEVDAEKLKQAQTAWLRYRDAIAKRTTLSGGRFTRSSREHAGET